VWRGAVNGPGAKGVGVVRGVITVLPFSSLQVETFGL
jgi:hypothetical protein